MLYNKSATSTWKRVLIAAMLTTSLASAGLLTTWDASSGLMPSEVGQPWNLVDSASPENPTLGGGVLSLSTSSSSENMYYIQSGISLDTSGSFFMEFTMRYVSGSSSSSSRAPVAVGFTTSPNTGNTVWIDQDKIFFLNGVQSVGPSITIDTDDSFHTYRLELDATGSMELYYDGSVNPVLSGNTFVSAAEHGTVPRILWGDASIYTRGSSEWTSFSHNAVIPEPMTISLCIPAFIGIMAFRRLRIAH